MFQTTVRFGSCRELAEEKQALMRLSWLYGALERSSTPAALLFPWFPSPARKAKEKITEELFVLLSHYVDVRRKSSIVSNDAIDVLLARGWDSEKIVAVIISFAGLLRT